MKEYNKPYLMLIELKSEEVFALGSIQQPLVKVSAFEFSVISNLGLDTSHLVTD